MSNSVLFVSLGPGDPELITLKALKALQEVDEVFCPAAGSGSRSAAILATLGIAPEKIRVFNVRMSEDRSAAVEAYGLAAEAVIEAHRAGRKIAVTAEGDAGFYSSSDYIAEILTEAEIPMTHIAGVPAFLACGALAGIPVVRLNEALEVVPGTITVGTLAAKLAEDKTVVVMKASRCEAQLKRAMTDLLFADFHYFENAGVAGKEFYSTDNEAIIAREFPYFSLMIIRATPV